MPDERIEKAAIAVFAAQTNWADFNPSEEQIRDLWDGQMDAIHDLFRRLAKAALDSQEDQPADLDWENVEPKVLDSRMVKAVTVDGDPVALTPKEYDILRFLMRNAGTVFSPNEIYRRVWDDVPLNATGAIAVHIRHLREKLEINPSEPRYIKVVWGKGYKMEGGIS